MVTERRVRSVSALIFAHRCRRFVVAVGGVRQLTQKKVYACHANVLGYVCRVPQCLSVPDFFACVIICSHATNVGGKARIDTFVCVWRDCFPACSIRCSYLLYHAFHDERASRLHPHGFYRCLHMLQYVYAEQLTHCAASAVPPVLCQFM